jgi:hypothetical protein
MHCAWCRRPASQEDMQQAEDGSWCHVQGWDGLPRECLSKYRVYLGPITKPGDATPLQSAELAGK